MQACGTMFDPSNNVIISPGVLITRSRILAHWRVLTPQILLCKWLQMIATGPYWWYVNIGSVNGLVPSGNKQLFKPMSTRTEFNIAIWCHQATFCGIMTPYNDIDLVQIGSGNEWLVVWRRQACSALSHYMNKLKGRWFETSWRPCCVTVKTMLQNAISILQIIKTPVRECGG